MPTTYTYHAAADHQVKVAFGLDRSMADTATELARADLDAAGGKTRRYYVHNGTGVIAAFLTRNGSAHQIMRQDYLDFSDQAKQARAAHQITD